MKIEVNIEKKHFYFITGLIVLMFGVFIVNAYNPYLSGGTPSIMGHSADELDVELGGNTLTMQQVFNSITDSEGNIIYANNARIAEKVEWENIENKPNSVILSPPNCSEENNVLQWTGENWQCANIKTEELIDQCDWEGEKQTGTITTSVSCSGCCGYGGWCQSGSCQQPKSTPVYTECEDGQIVNIREGSPSYGTCSCSGSCDTASCLVSGTQILMGDGSYKNIEDVQVGDLVKGPDNAINKVLALERPIIAERGTYIINDEIELTGDHPLLTTEGWKVPNLEQYIQSINIPNEIMQEIIYDISDELDLNDFIKEVKHRLEVIPENLEIGDKIITKDGVQEVKTIAHSFERPRDEIVYEIALDGNKAYFANGYVVHNR
ncbi:hypothetical protein K9L16_02875 [Candidatus Pacearchaeota archaeon]|nr:hypothetical protein [Candidatus Pacearchaeota archaeon]